MAILWLGDKACDDVQLVGGKAANSSRVASGYRVPARFCITPNLYQAWLTTRDQGLGPNQDLRDLVSRLSMYSLLVSIPLLLSSRDDSSPLYRPDSLCDVRWNDRVVLRGRAPDR